MKYAVMNRKLISLALLFAFILSAAVAPIGAFGQSKDVLDPLNKKKTPPAKTAPAKKPAPKKAAPSATTKKATPPATAKKPTPPPATNTQPAVKSEPAPVRTVEAAPSKPTVEIKPQPRAATRPEPPRPKPGPTIWRDPGRVERIDFRYGPWGPEQAPRPPFTFVEEDLGGSNPKIKVTDAAGREWGVKWGSEVNSEVFASRLVAAAGYYVEAAFFVPQGKIIGATALKRAKKYIAADGSFQNARFELKEKGIRKLNQEESWRFDTNPFVGTTEYNGLRLLMLLTSNWDSKDQRDAGRGSNTAIFNVKATGEERYVITDWGGSMGKWGNYFSREKWDCKGYQRQNREFITSARNGTVEFGYKGQRTSDIAAGIRTSDLKWLVQFIGRITDQQLRDALEASGATPEEIGCFTVAVRERLDQLKRIAELSH